ncbi:hypothetical protein DFP72DRAFT_192504 [Ephemerocybe angulata]|uniref:Uncharacterized protein n=1 Tax=Ephemerocybe angulata TaxID=980116 RepID=A0A8H6M828_9AGAR|nr:hypothetical protein DFP72DRAFT_192504 [Tulosesus angulatus]
MPTAAVLDSCSMEHPARPPSTTRRTHQNDVGDLPRPADSDLVASPSQTTSSTRTDPVGREGVRQGQNELDNVRQAYLLVLEHDEDDPLDGTMSTDPRRRRRRMHLDLDDSQHAAPCQVPVNDAQNTRTTWKTYRMPARHRCPTYSPSLHHHKRRRGSIRQATLNTERKCVRANTSLTTCNSLTCVLSSAAAVARVDGRRRHQLDHNTQHGSPCRNTVNDAQSMQERHRRLTANATSSKPRRLTTMNDDDHPSGKRPGRRKNVCQCRHDLDDVRMTDLCNMRAALDDDEDEGGWWWKGGKCGGERYGRGDAAKRERLGKYDISSVGETVSREHRPELVVCDDEQGPGRRRR